MERPRALARRTCAFILCVTATAVLGAACNPKIEELSKERSKRDTLGQEIYKVLCRRVAGIEIPGDVEGRQTETLCRADQESAAAELEAKRATLPPRLVAIAERRKIIADALDEGFPDDSASGLEDMMRELLPFYDEPGEEAQQGTRRMAAVLRALAADDVALTGMERFAREGMLPEEGDFGALRALLSYRSISSFMATVLPAMIEDEPTAKALREALAGFALEMGTNELETDPSSDTCQTRDLLSRTEKLSAGESGEFASGKPLFTTARDVRGMPIPKRENDVGSADVISACAAGTGEVRPVPYPFVDGDNDGFADVEGPNFSVDPGFSGVLPEPYPVTGETLVDRDAHGRALGIGSDGRSDPARSLYVTKDTDSTVLAAALREAARAFSDDIALLKGVAGSVPALVGDEQETVRRYEKATHTYQAADPKRSPVLGVMQAGAVTSADATYDESLELSLKLLREQEPAIVASVEPMLAIERRTRPGNDAYPNAKLEPGNTFWEEMMWEAEKLSRRRNVKGGETVLEAAVRASLGFGRNFDKPDAPMEQLIDPRLLSQQGALLAMMMRFKDEWRANPLAASKRPAGDPAIIGSLRVPVDRGPDARDTPITCGKDGCGGLIVGSPFERWKQDGQTCMMQIPGRTGKDCGATANQSLFHRSMSMLAELEGRSQCNKPITVRDLFDFASGDESTKDDPALNDTIRDAEDALAHDYTCPPNNASAPCRAYAKQYPAAFVERSDELGALPVAIQECGLLNVADMGRTFGQVMTHEYRLDIPNPWVRRYLEDVARAADSTLPTCPDFFITDPTVVPPCITEAAHLSRGVFEKLVTCAPTDPDPACIDTLGELIEFLLDDKELFQSERDMIELRPDARTLSRVMFTPAGAGGGFQMFDPLLVRGAPQICKANDRRPKCDAGDPAQDATCCIRDIADPPLRFRVDTFFGATTYAWEHMFKLKGGKELSFLDATKPLADAFNRLDIPKGANPADYENQEYLLTHVGYVVATHYDSPRNLSAQNKEPNRPGYSKLTGLVRYEELLADLVDDGTTDLTQKGPHGEPMFDPKLSFTHDQQLGMLAKGTDLLLAMDAMTNFHGGDGISSLARSTEVLLNPHAFCAGEGGDSRVVAGRGACDSASRAREPIAALDGRDYQCWDDGTCFDGSNGPKRWVSAADLLMDAASDFDARAKAVPGMYESARGVLSGLLDAYATIENGHLAHRRLRALVLVMGDFMRERWAKEKAAGTLSTWAKRSTDDAIDMLTNPAIAGALHTLQALAPQEGLLEAVSSMLYAMLDEHQEPAASRAFLAFLADGVQALPGDAGSNAILRNAAMSFAPNLDEVLNGKQKVLDIDGSVAWNSVFMLGKTGQADHDDVLGVIAGAMSRARGAGVGNKGTIPVSDLVDTVIDINRADPSQTGQHSAADYRSAFARIADVMLDDRTGFERLYALVRCSRHPHDEGCE